MKGQSASGVLGKLAAGLTASDDINKAQQFQAENDSVSAIKYYEKVYANNVGVVVFHPDTWI